ncbi:MAG: hypothetical protein DMF85_02955 [Acidobacteria bacterium]|nr:MAG: hypothetical protein DMF85_02955 [Acidobacteriota bacterium]
MLAPETGRVAIPVPSFVPGIELGVMQLKRPLGAVVVACVILAIAPMRAARDEGVSSKTGLVVCTSAPACDAGAAVLARGGNAVDAAVATAFALAVTHPSAGNIGGGGFMIVRTPNDVSGPGREDRPLADGGRLPRARRARHRPRTRARPSAVRQARVEGRRDACRRSRGAGIRHLRCARAQSQRSARRGNGAFSGVGRSVRKTGRWHMERRRSSRPDRSREDAALDRSRRPGRLL